MTISVLSMSDEAKEHLQALAKWVETAKMELERKNMWRCIDSDRFEKWHPLLKSLDLYNEGNGITLWRISGRESIGPDPGFHAIFIPLSPGGADICDKHLQPGEYLKFTGAQSINAQLDFLSVIVPKSDSR